MSGGPAHVDDGEFIADREEIHEVKIVTVGRPCFLHVRQAVRIRRQRRRIGEKGRQAEAAHAVTGPRAEQAAAKKIAVRARAHRGIENTARRTEDATFGEGASPVRRHSRSS
ncbi:hypothetical protein ACIQVL_45490 [Streptomyces sp. NPDC090499]|uniref:hypothetical protein n=1 Tax=Streptomyces sp. NPDC090499 TaxID=3365965 RepID=UPI00381E1301